MTNHMNRRLVAGASIAMFAAAASLNPMLRGPAVAYAPNGNEGGDTATLMKEVKQELERINGEVKQTAEKALQESKDAGKVSAEVKAAADKLLTEQVVLKDKADKLEARQLEIEQKLAGRREDRPDQARSIGQQVAESDDLKAYVAGGARGAVRIGVQQAITSAGNSAGGLITTHRDGELVRLRRRAPRIRSLLNVGRTTSNLVEYARQTTRTNAASVVAEGAQKPESGYAWVKDDAPVRTIAHWVPISRQALEDAAQLQTEIDSELRYGLDLAEDEELLNGDGTGEHLHGLLPQATAFAPAFAIDGETPIDTLRMALLQLELADYAGDGFVLNPIEWTRIELTKNTVGDYIFANVLQLAGPTLWGRTVVPTTAMDAGDFLAGEFGVAGTIYDRMDAEVLISSEDRDNFIKNMLTARAEKRLALAVKRPTALVAGEFPLAE